MDALSPEAKIPREVKRLGTLFSDAGHEIRVVGGWVRDSLRGIEPKDLDLATTATPDEMVALCERHNLRHFGTGLQHGTVTVLPTLKNRAGPKALHDDYKRSLAHPEIVPAYEITTLRVDTETDGRHATVEFTTDWRTDAARRDFTINSLSMNMKGEVFDYFDGIKHMADKRIVFVGDPAERIREDYLRILRYFRFRSRMDDRTHDHDTLKVIATNAAGLQQISVERVWMEMSKILAGNPTMVSLMLIEMMETGVLAQIGLSAVESYDIVHASIVRGQTANPLTVLAALTGSEMGQTWKMSNHEGSLLRFLQRYRRIPRPPLSFFKNVAVTECHDWAIECCNLFGPSDTLDRIRAWTPPTFPVRGEDLIEQGHQPGRPMGDILRRLNHAWRDSDYQLDKSALLAMV